MKKVLTLSLLALIFAFAAERGYSAELQTKEGTQGIFVGLSGLSDLKFDDGVFGYQYMFADRAGIWADISIKGTSEEPYKDADKITHTDIGIDAGYINYLFQKGSIGVYVSPQLGFSVGSSEEYPEAVKTTTSSSSIYFGCSIGAEWWFADGVSLTSSFLLGYSMSSKKVEAGASTTESKFNEFGFLSNGGKFLLAFYF
jgi:hypothetical protein